VELRIMPFRDVLLAGVVVLVWGLNFVVIKVGLQGVPPLLLGALRFTFAAFPAVLFIPRPRIHPKWILAYGLTINVGQFAFLFPAIHAGMPAGLASLVLQAQAFFTLFLAWLFLAERWRAESAVALLVAAGGLALIGRAHAHAGLSVAGFALTLCAAFCWSVGNVVTKRIGQVDLLGLVAWGALVAPVPYLALSLAVEGRERVAHALVNLDRTSLLAVAYLSFGATLLGYTLWGRLLARHPTHRVAPLTLLVPVVGLLSASALLGEKLTAAQCAGGALVMCGLLVNTFGARARAALAGRSRAVTSSSPPFVGHGEQ
jgi:O-acetylserine/cysteine efflux transporter